jgi:hypothetical protein
MDPVSFRVVCPVYCNVTLRFDLPPTSPVVERTPFPLFAQHTVAECAVVVPPIVQRAEEHVVVEQHPVVERPILASTKKRAREDNDDDSTMILAKLKSLGLKEDYLRNKLMKLYLDDIKLMDVEDEHFLNLFGGIESDEDNKDSDAFMED